MKTFNNDLNETTFIQYFKNWWKDIGWGDLAKSTLTALTASTIACFMMAGHYESKNDNINNEDIIAEETNAQDKIYNIELADGTIVSFTEEEYENFKEYLNSIKAEEEKTYKLTR